MQCISHLPLAAGHKAALEGRGAACGGEGEEGGGSGEVGGGRGRDAGPHPLLQVAVPGLQSRSEWQVTITMYAHVHVYSI